MTMMTLDETTVFNNMTNAIINLIQSKCICDIIHDSNELILTLRGRNHHITVTMTPVQIKTETKQKAKTKDNNMTKAKPVQKQTETKDKIVTKAIQKKPTKAPAPAPAPAPMPGRGKVECQCGLMICCAAMSRHEKGTKHKEAMAKKEKTEMKQAEGQTLGVNDMDLVDIDTYMKVMLPYLYKKVR